MHGNHLPNPNHFQRHETADWAAGGGEEEDIGMNSADAYTPEPLIWNGLSDQLSGWKDHLRSDRFWVMLLDNVKASARVRDVVAKAVVWLEMKGLADQAKKLDDAVQATREAVFACRQAMAAHGPSKAKDIAEIQSLRDAWVASVENLRGVVDQVMAEVPPEIWEGIDG